MNQKYSFNVGRVLARVGRMSVALSAVCIMPRAFFIRRITACGLIRPTALPLCGAKFYRVFLATLLFAAAPPTYAEELGRLFFTPEQRTQLERAKPEPAKQQNGDSPNNARVLTVNGIVQKHGGERTVWINGVPQLAGKSDERAPESLPVAVPGQSKPVKVKVGQKIILDQPAPQNPPASGSKDKRPMDDD